MLDMGVKVIVDRIALKKSAHLLEIHAHATAFLTYEQYMEALSDLQQSVCEPGIETRVLLTNCMDECRQMECFITQWAEEHQCQLETVIFQWNETGNDLCIQVTHDEQRYAFEEIMPLLSLSFPQQHVQCCVLPALNDAPNVPTHAFISQPTRQPQVKEKKKTSKSAKTAGFMPDVKRKLIDGNAFAPRTLLEIGDLSLDSGVVSVMGRPISFEAIKTKRGEGYVISFSLTDHYETVQVKWFPRDERTKMRGQRFLDPKGEFAGRGKIGVKGVYKFDAKFAKTAVLFADDITWFDVPPRTDEAQEKRVELHAHTKMSQDGLADTAKLISTAASFGHEAIAITDHGVVQSFPDAFSAAQKAKIKLIYGVEAYLANDMPYEGEDASLDDIIVFDIETTGLNPKQDAIIEIGAVRLEKGQITQQFQTFVDPKQPLSSHTTELTGIDATMLQGAPSCEEALKAFDAFTQSLPLVAHNAHFDVSFIRNAGKPYGCAFSQGILDTLTLARMLLPSRNRHGLAALVKEFSITLANHHRACDDAQATAQVLLALLSLAGEHKTLCALNGIGQTRMLPTYHAILLVKNQQGLNDLYRLVTQSHLAHFHRRPVMPKSLLTRYASHILYGSACEQGEVFRAVLGGYDDQIIQHLAGFYDYLEIQPIENNRFLIRDEREASHIQCDEDLQQLNRRIVELGELLNKPVVATTDMHFIEPEDEYYRRILLTGQGFSDMDEQPPLYLHTTHEMLDDFAYLGEQKAKEVVVDNTRLIASWVEDTFWPFLHDKETYVPEEAGGKELMCSIALEGAEKMYGTPLPPVIQQRLDHELGCITQYGFEVLYLAAHRLVKKSMSDGYSVGSRGSVGSSFAAIAMGISEVNPLPTHYRCPHCCYADFDVTPNTILQTRIV